MREGRGLTKVPLPTALAGKRFGEVGQIRRVIRGNNFSRYAFAVVLEKGVGHGFTDFFMSDLRQQFNQIRDPTTHGGDPLRLKLFLIRVEVIRETTEVGIQQQRTVVEPAIFSFSIRRT
ncbi:hypothetical protein D3C81_1579270 [compost metagenome]